MAILILGVFEDGFDIDAGELDADGGLAFGAGADADLADTAGPATAEGRGIAAFGAGNKWTEAAVVQGSEPGTREPAQRLQVGRHAGKDQGACDAFMGAQLTGLGIVRGELLQVVIGSPGIGFDERAQLALPEFAGVIELLLKAAERIVAIRISTNNSPTGTSSPRRMRLRACTRIWAMMLSTVRSRCNEEATATRISMRAGVNGYSSRNCSRSLLLVMMVSMTELPSLDAGELGFDELAGSLVLRLEQPAAGDGGQVSIFQGDGGKALLPPFQSLFDQRLVGAEARLSDEIADSTLTCHEAHDGRGAIGLTGFHQLGELGAFASDPCGIGCAAGQPEDHLIQEEDHRVIAQRFRVLADERSPVSRSTVATVWRAPGIIVGRVRRQVPRDHANADRLWRRLQRSSSQRAASPQPSFVVD